MKERIRAVSDWTACHHTQMFEEQLSQGLACECMGLTRGAGAVGILPCQCRWQCVAGRRDVCLFFFSAVKNRGLGRLLHLCSIQGDIAAGTQLHLSLVWRQTLQSLKSVYDIVLAKNLQSFNYFLSPHFSFQSACKDGWKIIFCFGFLMLLLELIVKEVSCGECNENMIW